MHLKNRTKKNTGIFMVSTVTGKRESIFQSAKSQEILENSGNFRQNTGKIRES